MEVGFNIALLTVVQVIHYHPVNNDPANTSHMYKNPIDYNKRHTQKMQVRQGGSTDGYAVLLVKRNGPFAQCTWCLWQEYPTMSRPHLSLSAESILDQHNPKSRSQPHNERKIKGIAYLFSNITLQTATMVLSNSVVFSIGTSLCCRGEKNVRYSLVNFHFQLLNQCRQDYHISQLWEYLTDFALLALPWQMDKC